MNQRVYQLLSDAYYGDGIFMGGRGLRRHPREQEFNYRDRQALAYYLNYTGPIVDACVNPVFRDDIRREYRNGATLTAFMDDCDRLGTDLQDFMRRGAKYAKLYGAVYVLVNNTAERGSTLANALSGRKFPFLSLIMPAQIEAWEHSDTGELVSLTWTERRTDEDRTITLRHTWTNTAWLVEEDGKPVLSGEHRLGRLPIVRWCGRTTEPTEVLPTSEFISVAQANYFLYQICSWHTQILRDQAFSILTLPTISEDDVTVGTNNVLTYPPDATHVPSFIAPSADPAAMLTDQMDRIIREMYRMCGLSSVIGVQEAKSGVAKQWDFEKTNQKLADFALQCEQAEQEIIRLFDAWTGGESDYFCEYPRDFKINDVADALSAAQSALDLGLGGKTYRTEVGRKVLDGYMPNIEPETYDAIIAEFGREDDDQDHVYGDEVGDEARAED
ncbi:MAG: hypothetical protein E6041_05170 [Escherichia coli]|nr:hypothetical protein [Escherichia coli]